MSEKRFTLHLPINEKDGTMGYIVDHLNKSTYFIRGENARKDIVNLLNKLNDENEQLRNGYKIPVKVCDLSKCSAEIDKLRNENEQLLKYKILANAFIVEKGLEIDFINWSANLEGENV